MYTQKLSIPKWICSLYISKLNSFNEPVNKSNLADGNLINYFYSSKRNKLVYIYLSNILLRVLNKGIMLYIYLKTGISFKGSINHKVTPFFIYNEGYYVLPHQDRDMVSNKLVSHIAVLLLQDNDTKAELYTAEEFDADAMGKVDICTINKVQYHTLSVGDILIIDNLKVCHGVTKASKGTRITTGFRSKTI
jgi:hypothetical protein